MPTAEQLFELLEAIEASLKREGKHIKFYHEPKSLRHMKFTRDIGTLCVLPSHDRYRMELSGEELVRRMTQKMIQLIGNRDGYKNRKAKAQPYWYTDDFEIVKDAINHYANI